MGWGYLFPSKAFVIDACNSIQIIPRIDVHHFVARTPCWLSFIEILERGRDSHEDVTSQGRDTFPRSAANA